LEAGLAGKSKAVSSARVLTREVRKLAESLGLEVHEQYRLGRRLWGARRQIDLILKGGPNSKTLGIECKFQKSPGTVEEKIPTTIKDIDAWPIDGIVVFNGVGFTQNMISFLLSTGKAVEFQHLEPWLRLYFDLPLSKQTSEIKD
jgi:hypothetical protein